MPYYPPRQREPKPPKDPLEIDLVFNIRPCGTCAFFWPNDASQQPYGPYPAYDFNSNTPETQAGGPETSSFHWLKGTTRPPVFPDPEVMDGCRKAPIMTIGINPNLTAFAPGRTGASWCYPSFSSLNGTDSWTKYAYYYRYRSVYQEHFDPSFVEQFLIADGAITAERPGLMKEFIRPNSSPSYEIRVVYDGDPNPTAIHIPGELGTPRYVVLFDQNTRFKAGDVLAARVVVRAGESADICAQPEAYYMQIIPVLRIFENYLSTKGHAGAHLQVGEDVGQLDMVACASPHWGADWLGGNTQGVNTVVRNCVHANAWAMKQILQSRPAILFLVGQASWNMFRQSFERFVKGPAPIPSYPEDGPYTLLRLTTQNEYRFEFSTDAAGQAYTLSTRLVITPHFSYNINFLPQFRLSPEVFQKFEDAHAAVIKFFHNDPRFRIQAQPGSFIAIGILRDCDAALTQIQNNFPESSRELMAAFYDPHKMMADVLQFLYDKGELSYTGSNGQDATSRFLSRSDGPCTFCVNEHWQFPEGCPYGKPKEQQYPVGFLEKVSQALIHAAAGRT